jgi:acyl transferase domain-containing protein
VIDPRNPDAIAIIGLAGRFPGARDLDEFWRNIRNGVESLETFSDEDLDAAGVGADLRDKSNYVRKGTVLEDADRFDAGFFGYPPREAQIIDPQQRVFLECAWEAIEHAGYAGNVAGQSVGVYAGTSGSSYLFSEIVRAGDLAGFASGYQVMLGNDKDYLCTRVSYKLDLRGPSVTVQTACSTSLVAVHIAARALRRGECDLALAGGVSILFPERAGYEFNDGMIFSPDGHCRPFDENARGTRAGSGAGVVVLKRLSDALDDRDTIHAVILGTASNNDGAAKAGFTAPSIDGQVEVIATAQALANVDPRTITYLEAHGTATPLGDPIEIAAATQVFRDTTDDVGFCRLGSLKANIGHLDAAAGVAGLIKTVLALRHRELPPLVNFTSPNPQLELARSPFHASAVAAPWTASDGPRRAGVSSFGIGGTNAHAVLEEAPPAAPAVTQRNAHLIILSARTPAALEAATSNLAAFLETNPSVDLADVAYTLQVGRAEFAERRSVVAHDASEASALLRSASPAVSTGSHSGGTRPVAFLFSGQGSQHPKMGLGLHRTERRFREAFDSCATILSDRCGIDAHALLDGGDALAIGATANAQPLLFAVEYALASLWNAWGVHPAAMLGHSIGEYVAAHLAGVMSLEDAVYLVAERGRLMQATPPGTMIAVQLPETDLARWLTADTEIAAINAPDMCAVSGPAGAITALVGRLAAAGVTHRQLHTSHAFHSAMMDSAMEPFGEMVSRVTLKPPVIPYISNVTGTWITADQATSPSYYAAHLRQPVRFAAGVRTLTDDRPDVLLEVGPGTAVATLARMTLGRDARPGVVASLSRPVEGRGDTESILDAAGRLWVSGVKVDWNAVHADDQLHRVPLPTYPFERQSYRISARGKAPPSAQSAGGSVQSAPPPVAARPRLATDFEAPVTETEHRIALIWTELLGIENIGRRDRFFELGGDSLMTTRVVARLRAAFGRDIDVDRVFALQTIAELAALVDEGAAAQRETVSF